jgi:acyl-CoA thioesterase FadM
MSRVKIDLPESFPFEQEVRVRISDINYGGHLGNDAILSIIHEARLGFLANYGFSELEVGEASLIMADSAVVYRSEGFHGDLIRVSVAVDNVRNSGFDLFYRLVNTESDKEIAIAKTGMVCFDYKERKVCPVPDAFKNAIGA